MAVPSIKSGVLAALRLRYPHLSGASVLAYHSIGENGAYFTVPPRIFEQQLLELKKSGRTVIQASELCRRLVEGESIEGCVVLTFDDGYQDNLANALPLLRKYGFNASIFVITGLLGQTLRNRSGIELSILSEAELRALHQSGVFEVLPHTHTHPKLTEIPLQEAVREAEASRTQLERDVRSTEPILAYPKGRYTPEIARSLESAGWRGAYATAPGIVHLGDDLYTLKRNGVYAHTTLFQFRALLCDAVEAYEKLRNTLGLR